MGFSDLINRLVPEGATAIGTRPKTILADNSGPGSEPGYYDTTPLGNLYRQLQTYQIEEKAKEEQAMKKKKDQSDMYRTLRDAGYEPKKAYEAVISKNGITEPGGETLKETETAAKVGKIKSQTLKDEAMTEQIKKKTDSYDTSAESLKQRIVRKVADGEDLTPGEQKVYDEVIRKFGQRGGLDAILAEKSGKAPASPKAAKAAKAPPKVKDTGDFVPMTDPIGRKKLVPRANVEKAKAKGWKLR